ncbi:MAG: hypothetical protein ABL934_07475 [Lysobacteraceae bacterium]
MAIVNDFGPNTMICRERIDPEAPPAAAERFDKVILSRLDT